MHVCMYLWMHPWNCFYHVIQRSATWRNATHVAHVPDANKHGIELACERAMHVLNVCTVRFQFDWPLSLRSEGVNVRQILPLCQTFRIENIKVPVRKTLKTSSKLHYFFICNPFAMHLQLTFFILQIFARLAACSKGFQQSFLLAKGLCTRTALRVLIGDVALLNLSLRILENLDVLEGLKRLSSEAGARTVTNQSGSASMNKNTRVQHT